MDAPDPSLVVATLLAVAGALVFWMQPTRRANASLGPLLVVLGVSTASYAMVTTAPDLATAATWAALGVWANLLIPLLTLLVGLALVGPVKGGKAAVAVVGALTLAGILAHLVEPRLFVERMVELGPHYGTFSGPLMYAMTTLTALVGAGVAWHAGRVAAEEDSGARRASASVAGLAIGLSTLYTAAFFLTFSALTTQPGRGAPYLLRVTGTLASGAVILIATPRLLRPLAPVSRRLAAAGLALVCGLGLLDGLVAAQPVLFAALPGYDQSVVAVRLAVAVLLVVAAVRFGLADAGEDGRRRVGRALVAGMILLAAVAGAALGVALFGPNPVGAATALAIVAGVLAGRAPLLRAASALRDRLLLPFDDPRAVAERARRYAAAVEAARGLDGALLPEGERLLATLRADLGVSQREHDLLAEALQSRRSEDALLGRYRIEREIGGGSTATALLARDPDGRAVVVKRFHGRAADAALREARVLHAIRHPRVVRVVEVDKRGGEVFLVMEHAPGGSARDALDREGPLPPERACALVADALDGLAALHAAGLVHRDVKPENLLLDAQGRAMLADFGSAGDAPRADDTLTGAAVEFTFATAAPELVRGERATPASDVYSAGATLYRLLTGEHYVPLAGATAFDARDLVLREEPTLPHARVPAEAEPILRAALAKRPGERPAAAAMRDALLRIIPAGTPAGSGQRQ